MKNKRECQQGVSSILRGQQRWNHGKHRLWGGSAQKVGECHSLYWSCLIRNLSWCVSVCLPVTSAVEELNTTSLSGDTVTLPCQSLLNNTDVDWRHQDTPTSPVYYVYTNGVVYDIFRPRFSVGRQPDQGKYYDLVISRVQPSDAGLYICIDDAGLGEQLFIYQLYVLSGMDLCTAYF